VERDQAPARVALAEPRRQLVQDPAFPVALHVLVATQDPDQVGVAVALAEEAA
jgi:hypothetical protein